jgi:hypothetical protein
LTLDRPPALLGRAVLRTRKADVEPLPDLATLSDDQLRALIADLKKEEDELSYRRRLLHGKIDILRAELVARLQKSVEGGESALSADIEKLTEILSAKAPPPDEFA